MHLRLPDHFWREYEADLDTWIDRFFIGYCERLPLYRLLSGRDPQCRCRVAPQIPGMDTALLRRIGRGIPHEIGANGVDRAIGFCRNPPGREGFRTAASLTPRKAA